MEPNLERLQPQFQTPQNVWSPTLKTQNQPVAPHTPFKQTPKSTKTQSSDMKKETGTPSRKLKVCFPPLNLK